MIRFILSLRLKFARRWGLNDLPKRSLVKTISWRLTGSLATFIVSYIILGDYLVAGSIATIQIITNTLLYYVHERVWNKIKWGIRTPK
jgi:uncharacterized membrane protein